MSQNRKIWVFLNFLLLSFTFATPAQATDGVVSNSALPIDWLSIASMIFYVVAVLGGLVVAVIFIWKKINR